jgi:molybdate transport system ATP-binding protein
MESSYLLSAESDVLQYAGVKLVNHHKFAIYPGFTYAVIGPNGAGKTILAKIIEKGWNIATNVIRGDKQSLKIKSIEFSDIHALTGCRDSYYQQRFEATQNESIPTVDELIAGKIPEAQWDYLCQKLSIGDIRHKRVNFLSSGELRKFLIMNLFTDVPDILIIDNPYIGLDAPSRDLLDGLLSTISSQGTAVLLLLCNPSDVPEFTDFVLPVQNLNIGAMQDVRGADKDALRTSLESLFPPCGDMSLIPQPSEPLKVDYTTAFELRHCDVSYGSNIILKDISWRVDAGEKWALLGENGAGKSTLLSLVYADNPQGYRNDITLFDHRRGTGESIWEIKRRIGYISPEMHLYFNNGEDTLTVVASGFHDNVGCFRRLSDDQLAVAHKWLRVFGLDHLASRRFPTLSSGEQRLALLARTFLKHAPLLILDEPLHGLDMAQKRLVAQVIRQVTSGPGMSLIYVTHYQQEIPSTVTHTFRLKKYRPE